MIGGSIAGAISAGSSLIAIRLLPDSAIAPSTKGSYLVAIVRGSVGVLINAAVVAVSTRLC